MALLPFFCALLATPWWVLGCGDEAGAEPVFERDFQSRLEEIRPCFQSHEHELRYVRVFADPVAAEVFRRCVLEYTGCTEIFPVGSLFVKLEFDGEGCTDFVEYTAVLKEEPGARPEGGDWRWQRVTPDFEVIADGAPGVCLNCHANHCSPPYGHDLRCSEE